MQETGADCPVSRGSPVMGPEQRGDQVVVLFGRTGNRMTSQNTTDKPFRIEKRQVYEAYKAVKANHGAARVDGQTLATFEKDLAGNLYKVWTDVLRDVLPTAGSRCLHSKEEWRRKGFGCAHRQRSDRADGGQADD